MVEHNDIEDDAPQDLTTDSTGKSEPKPPADGGAAPLPAAKRAGDGTGAPEGQPDGGEQPMEGEGGKGAGEGESDDSGGQGGDKKSEKGNEGKDEGDEEEGGDKKSEKGNEGKDEGDDEGDDGDSDDEDDSDEDEKKDEQDEEDLVGKAVGIIEKASRHHGMAGTVVSKKSADAWNVLFPPQWEWEYSRDEFVVEGDTVYFLKNKMTRVGKIQSIFLNVDFCEIMSAGTEFKIPIKDIIKKVADKKDKDEDKDGSEETRFATLEIIRQVFAEYGLKLNLDTADNITLYAHAMFTPTITEAIGEIYFQHIHPDEKLKEVVELDLVVAKKIMSIIVDKPEYFEKDGEVRKFTDVLTDIGATSLVFSTTILADENGDDNGEDNWNLTLTPISPLVSSRKDKADLILVIPKHGNAGNVRLNYLARGMKELYVFHNLDAKSDYAVEFDDYLWLIKEFNNAKAKRLIVSREYNNFAVSKIKEYLNKLSDAV